MTENAESHKFELYLSAESVAKINALISAGTVSSTSEALLLAVDWGLDKLAED
jgi:hypothetical protein